MSMSEKMQKEIDQIVINSNYVEDSELDIYIVAEANKLSIKYEQDSEYFENLLQRKIMGYVA